VEIVAKVTSVTRASHGGSHLFSSMACGGGRAGKAGSRRPEQVEEDRRARGRGDQRSPGTRDHNDLGGGVRSESVDPVEDDRLGSREPT